MSQRPSQPSNDIVLGVYEPDAQETVARLRVPLAVANNHIHVIGLSGMGKSGWLAGLALMLINRGQSVILIDPHGDLAQLLLAQLIATGAYNQTQMLSQVLYLDLPQAERLDRYLPFNILNQPYKPHVVSRLVLEAMRRTWPDLADGHAVGIENILLMGTRVLIANRLPLPLLHDILVHKEWRDQLLSNVADHEVRRFFHERFDRLSKDRIQNIEPVLRRLLIFTSSPVLRYSLSQADNLLDFRALYDSRRSLIINLALGDSEERKLLGCLLTVYAEQGALSREDTPPEARTNAHLILDEFHQFAAQSQVAFETILSQTRKYGLSLVLANQTQNQIPKAVQGALQNCGIRVAFRLGRDDALIYAPVFGHVDPHAIKHEVEDALRIEGSHPLFYSLQEQWEDWAQFLTDLKPRQALIKLPNSRVEKIRTLAVAMPSLDTSLVEEVKTYYLQNLFQPQEHIEGELARYRYASSSTMDNKQASNKTARKGSRQTKDSQSTLANATIDVYGQTSQATRNEDDDDIIREKK